MLALALTADLTGVTDLSPVDTEDDPYFFTFKVQCTSCRETHPNWVNVSRFDSTEVSGSRGEANFVWKCKACKRESTASIKAPAAAYHHASPPTRQNIVEFDCRGLEFMEFKADGEWKAKGIESGTSFGGIDLQEGEWFDYDEKAGEEITHIHSGASHSSATSIMDAVDGTEHYEKSSTEPPPSLLTIVLDTNPHAWALLLDTLTLTQAVANLLVFINAHLAFNNANKVAVIASHIHRAEFLYPPPSTPSTTNNTTSSPPQPNGLDTHMPDAPSTAPQPPSLPRSNTTHPTDDANIYRPFSQIASTLFASLSALLARTTPSALASTPTTALAGALTLALTYTNKQSLLLAPSHPPSTASLPSAPALNARILVLAVSTASPAQYIPFMNALFAAQRLRIPIDVLALAGASSFLQQAADATGGTYVSLSSPAASGTPPPPHGLLPTLLLAFLPDATARAHLVAPTQASVDFRAACFCHRRVVDVGFVCSICLSIFCEPPEGAVCLTCGTHLRVGRYGARPAVVGRRKKRKEKGREGGGGVR
ncbi:RNA polymerase II transcription factor B subunit 4 [Lambiella insularis]|nr:RNA polymerase II transcription factor B subunit 4 [Lambiella insularis]